MNKTENRWVKLNQFLEKYMGLKSYGHKVVLVLITLFFITFVLANLLLINLSLEKEIKQVTVSLENVVEIKSSQILDRIENIEDNGKILIASFRQQKEKDRFSVPLFHKFKVEGIYDVEESTFIGKKLSLLPVDFKKASTAKYSLFGDYIIINLSNLFYIFVKKENVEKILNPDRTLLSEYEPVFILDRKPKNYSAFVCRTKKIENSNFFLTGCIEKNSIVSKKFTEAVRENGIIFLFFFILAVALYGTFFKNILLFPVIKLKTDIEKMNKEGLEKVRFTLHQYGTDEFAQISQVLEETRQKILKHQKGTALVLETTSKMISMTNDIHKFSLYTINRLDELLNAEGTVLCLYSKPEDSCAFKVHSEKYLIGTVFSQLENFVFEKFSEIKRKNSFKQISISPYNIILVKKEVNEEFSIYVTVFRKEGLFSDEDINYLDMVLSHLVYSINLLNLATYDPLTKMYNRRAVVQYATKEVERSIRYNHPFSVILLDIDDFKAVNDTYGHTIGDIVLKKIAYLIAEEVRETDKVGRYGGEEFIVILPETSVDNAVKLAERIRRKISEFSFEINNYVLTITVSIGVAGLGEHGKTFEEILQAADLALYEAKRKGKNRVAVLKKEEIEKIQREEFQSKNFLEKALQENRVIPFFQPIVDIKTGETAGYEILARIKDKNSIIPAYQFISTSIKFGIVLKIDEIVQQKTIQFLSQLDRPPKMLFFNLSRPYIQDIHHILKLVELLERYKIPKDIIVLEITEEEAISEITVVKEAIRIAKSKGIRFALDDFGVGYSTFSYIKHFDIDIIKLDGSLVKNINEDKDNQIIVGGIAYICRKKGIKLLAEMVETEEELETLKQLGVDYAQGFLFGKASPNMDKH
ncbi:putative bifunctional diguanylate cyclase/phosphodiesterase [Persephonella sp.]